MLMIKIGRAMQLGLGILKIDKMDERWRGLPQGGYYKKYVSRSCTKKYNMDFACSATVLIVHFRLLL